MTTITVDNKLTNSNLNRGGKRVGWIDLLKGLTIIGVIWVHAGGHPDWWTASTVNSLFFFIAGMFFKERPFIEFIKRHVNSLIIPFILFYLLAYPFRIMIELWDFRSIDSVTWNMIWNVFGIEARSDYLYSYVPLWFLPCLFWIQIFYWMIYKIPLWGKMMIFIVIWLAWDILYSIPTPLMINNALCWLLYFGLGQVLSNLIFKIVQNTKNTILIFCIGLLSMLITHFISNRSQFVNLFYISWCITMVMVTSLLDNNRYSKWLEFFGINSLIILGAHLWFLTPIMRLFSKINDGNNILTSITGTILCAIVLIPTIIYINRFCPLLAGKKHSSKSLYIKSHKSTNSIT